MRDSVPQPDSQDDSAAEPPAALLARVGATLHHYFLPLLLACYLLSAFFPGPGLALRHARVVLPTGNIQTIPMLLLALLLFCAAVSLQWTQVRDVARHPSVLLLALVTAWLGPALAVGAAAAILPRLAGPEAIGGFLVGLALVAAMPVANSSAGWSQNSGGNVALSLGLIVFSIVLSPLATPQMLNLMGFALSEVDTAKIEQVVSEFSGRRFIAWVILPSLAGAAVAMWFGEARVARFKPLIRLVTLVDLLLLNYANASLALPKVVHDEPIWTALAATGLAMSISVLGVLLGRALACGLRTNQDSTIALMFGLGMKHTGLALVLAGEVLADHPRVILVIVLATLMQHLVAAGVDALLSRRR